MGRRPRATPLQAIAALPPADVLDPQYKEDAAAPFEDIEKEKDET